MYQNLDQFKIIRYIDSNCVGCKNYVLWGFQPLNLTKKLCHMAVHNGYRIKRPLQLFFDNLTVVLFLITSETCRTINTKRSSSWLLKKDFRVNNRLLSKSGQTPLLRIRLLKSCHPKGFMMGVMVLSDIQF